MTSSIRRPTSSARGEALIRQIAELQSARFARAFAHLGADAEAAATAFLQAMTDGAAATDIACLDADDVDAFL